MKLEELGDRIRIARSNLGLTQNDVACALQVSPQAVSKWERGENAPDVSLLPELAVLLSVTTDRLLGTHAPSERTIEATVCFSDIAGFTRHAEGLSPDDVASLINGHYLQVTDTILQYDGVPVKYIGDSFLFFFSGPEHRIRSIRAALHVIRVASLEVSIGMCSGPVFFGRLGHPDYARMDVMGAVVNFAARAGGWAGKHGSRIAATGSTVDSVAGFVETGATEEFIPKGASVPHRLIEITGLTTP